MPEILSETFATAFAIKPCLMLIAGVVAGLLVGVVPGIGGLFGLSILLPLTMQMDLVSAIAVMIGFTSVTATSDTLPAVLIGVPGTVAAVATVEDGHPLARQGQSRLALGSAYSASMIGGIFGAIVLAFSIPILRPIVLKLQSPDFLAMSCFGLAFVAMISGQQVLKGLAAVLLGLMFATVGLDPKTGLERFTFGQDVFWDGLSISIVFIGLFGLPEIADLIRRGAIVDQKHRLSGSTTFDGIRETLRHWRLVLASSTTGTILGAIPGIGVTTIDWISYAIAKKTDRNGPAFGTGNIRGVIAPESANNAKEGGNLIPTLTLGIPGSVTMVFILATLTMQGVAPGPKLLSTQLPLVYSIALYIVLANVLGTTICLSMSNTLSRIALAPVSVLVPIVLTLVTLSSFKEHLSLLDVGLLMSVGAIGAIMKHNGWSRPAFALGFVLGPNIEHYYSLSRQLSGFDWISRPSIIFVICIFAAYIIFLMLSPKQIIKLISKTRVSIVDMMLCGVIILLLSSAIWSMTGADINAFQYPRLIMSALVTCSFMILLFGYRNRNTTLHWPREELIVALMILVLIGSLFAFGLWIAILLFVFFGIAALSGRASYHYIIYAIGTVCFAYLIFNVFQTTTWPKGIFMNFLLTLSEFGQSMFRVN